MVEVAIQKQVKTEYVGPKYKPNEFQITRAQIVQNVREWIGTPYHHQETVKGVGCDCLGLIRGVWRDLYVNEPEVPIRYSQNWMESRNKEIMYDLACKHMVLKEDIEARAPGDILLFRMNRDGVAKHTGILTKRDTDMEVECMVHSQEGINCTEVDLNEWWQKRITAVFEYPCIVELSTQERQL